MNLLKTHNPLYISTKSLSRHSIFIRNLGSSSSSSQANPAETNKSLHVLFQEAVGVRQKTETDSESESESESEENSGLKKGLRELEKEVRHLNAKENSSNQKSVSENAAKMEEPKKEKRLGLYSLFLDKNKAKYQAKRARREEEEPRVYKERSPDVDLLLTHLYRKGYFKEANFVPDNERKLDLSCFDDSYGRSFIKFAGVRFGKDNQEIAKWLSGSDLKKVALLGCPSLAKKTIFSAKQLRSFLDIQEDSVCSKCVLRQSCKFVNRSVCKGGNNNLRLVDVMRVITSYALESIPPELQVPEDVKASVGQLLKEVISLSQTTSKATPTSTF